MARLPLAEIRRIVRPCGLGPQKAKALKELSRILVARHGGRVPRSFEELEALPGVGHKTAGVVMVQAFGEPAFPVDTHIHRLAARFGLSNGRSVVQTERDLKRVFPKQSWGRVHLQLIYFGREHCPARSHDPEVCPICSWAAPASRRARKQREALRAASR
jgi:endonuclease-3